MNAEQRLILSDVEASELAEVEQFLETGDASPALAAHLEQDASLRRICESFMRADDVVRWMVAEAMGEHR